MNDQITATIIKTTADRIEKAIIGIDCTSSQKQCALVHVATKLAIEHGSGSADIFASHLFRMAQILRLMAIDVDSARPN